MNIGETIRTLRLGKGMSQSDIERSTGLLCCYLSRVENGHTIPSLDTLAKIASALDIPMAQFFGDGSQQSEAPPALDSTETRFLMQMRRYSKDLREDERKLIVAMAKKMAAGNRRVGQQLNRSTTARTCAIAG